jgi:O-antigen/teichoic acid export membrane protein
MKAASLKQNFSWAFVGNLVWAGSQWALLSVIAKLTTPDVVGKYALALAVCAPFIMIANFNIGVMLITDTERLYDFEAYRLARLLLIGFAFVLMLVVTTVSRLAIDVKLVCLIVALAQAIDCYSELYYSLAQRSEKLSWIATSLISRGVLSLAAAGALLAATKNLIVAVGAMAFCRLCVLLVYDINLRRKLQDSRDVSSTSPRPFRSYVPNAYTIAKTALPLAIVSFLASLSLNVPRYFIEKYDGNHDLGIFAAMWSLLTAGNMIAIALGQALFPRLSKLYAARDSVGFRRLTLRALTIGLGLGATGTLIASVGGEFILRTVYRPEYAALHGFFTALMGAGTILFSVTLLGYAATSARSFRDQAVLMMIVVLTTSAASALLVPRFRLWGAVEAVSIGNSVYFIGMLVIVLRVIQRIRTSVVPPSLCTEVALDI